MINSSRKLTFPPSQKESSLRTIRGYAKLLGVYLLWILYCPSFELPSLDPFWIEVQPINLVLPSTRFAGNKMRKCPTKNQSAHLKWLMFFSIPVLVSRWSTNYLGLEVRMPVFFQLRKNRHSKNQKGWFRREDFPLQSRIRLIFSVRRERVIVYGGSDWFVHQTSSFYSCMHISSAIILQYYAVCSCIPWPYSPLCWTRCTVGRSLTRLMVCPRWYRGTSLVVLQRR